MRHLFIFLITLFSLSVSAQTWCGGCAECEFINPAPAYDSVFVVMSDSRDGVAHCRGTWTNALDAGFVRYKVYTAYLTQTGSGSPTPTVLLNTLGEEPVWSRDSEGIYTATFQGEVFANPTPPIAGFISDDASVFFGEKISSTVYNIYTRDAAGGTLGDDLLIGSSGLPIEIRVYYP